MKKILSKKLFALILLVSLFSCFRVFMFPPAPAFAQDVQLLPNASPNDYQTETNPPQNADYKIETAQNPADILNLVEWIAQVLAGDIDLREWIKHLIIWGLDGFYWVLNGQTYDDTLAMGAGQIPENYVYTGGALGTVALAVDGVYSNLPNLHTGDFFKDSFANNILSTPAKAAVGTETLEPIKEIWKVLRNVSYVLFVLFLIAMGFMIMMRYRIDPRTTMTVTNALPRVAISLVLVAFSYPIAGFLVDIMNVLVGLIQNLPLPDVALQLPGGINLPFPQPEALDLNPLLFTFFYVFLSGPIINPLYWIGTLAFGPLGIPFLGGFLTIEALFRLIIFILVIYLIIKLIGRYVSLFVLTIFSPLAFAWGVLPGQENTISNWFKSFLVSVLSFPGVLFVLYVGYYLRFVNITDLPKPLSTAPIPGGSMVNLGALMYIGVLLLAAKIPEAIEDALDVAPSKRKAGLDIGKLPVFGSIAKGLGGK